MLKSTRTMIALSIIMACASAVCATEKKKPVIKLKGIAVKRIALTDQTAETSVSIEIENPGPAFKFKDASYRLKLNGQSAAEGKYKEEIQVPAASTITVDMPLTINLSALPSVTWSTITDGLNISYELDTEFSVPVFAMFTHRVRTTFSGDIPVGGTLTSLPGRLIDRIYAKPN